MRQRLAEFMSFEQHMQVSIIYVVYFIVQVQLSPCHHLLILFLLLMDLFFFATVVVIDVLLRASND